MNAAHKGHVGVVRLLVERGAELNHSAKYNLTALMLSVIARHPSVVRDLVKAGADTTLRGTGPFMATPLEYSEQMGYTEISAVLRGVEEPSMKE